MQTKGVKIPPPPLRWEIRKYKGVEGGGDMQDRDPGMNGLRGFGIFLGLRSGCGVRDGGCIFGFLELDFYQSTPM